MKILIVDDSIDKLSEVSKVLFNTGIELNVKTVEDIQGAMVFLEENVVDLLILDQFLPIRKGKDEKVLENGGYYLLNEINRKAESINPPKYIIGLSQYCEECSNFSDIWHLLKYSPTHSRWSTPLIKLLNHISRVNSLESSRNETAETLPTLFVEGLTDAILLKRIVDIHFKDFKNKFIIESQRNAGANWVAQQLVIWGHQLKRDSNGELIKAVGLFDLDDAGINAKKDAIKKLTTANQQEAVKVYSLTPKYSKNLVEFYRKGLQIEIEIESLLPFELLKYAEEQGWLEHRSPLFVETPKDLDQMSETIPAYLKRIEFPSDLSVYLKKVKLSKKEQFSKYVIEESNKSTDILDNLKVLMDDLLKTLLKDKVI